MEHPHFKEKVEVLWNEMKDALRAAISEYGMDAIKRFLKKHDASYNNNNIASAYFSGSIGEIACKVDELLDELEKERREEGEI